MRGLLILFCLFFICGAVISLPVAVKEDTNKGAVKVVNGKTRADRNDWSDPAAQQSGWSFGTGNFWG
ncbi:hypothetical protein L596_027193 [Steinernema carpocapsae]|uniref:Uncharacterized protein n=1 Tax=Steinernema carpocapsae TaxID=34508 RepID=A0A4U5M4P6_STECR|nr:hypothetical protein L596_027193 [Steinernema carpocapsae]